jgi:hypothetical protein
MRKIVLIAFVMLNLFQHLVLAQMAGNYTIGNNSDYSTIQAALDAIHSSGISAPVVFKIKQGTYNEQLSFYYISGQSALNTVTFQSETHDSSTVIITFDNPLFGIINGGNHCIFKYISLINTNETGYSVASSNYITIENSILEGNFRADIATCRNCKIFKTGYGDFRFRGGVLENCELAFSNTFTVSQGNGLPGIAVIKNCKITTETISIGFSSGTQVLNNEIIGNIYFGISSDNCYCVGNKIFGNLNGFNLFNLKIWNNFIYGTTELTACNDGQLFSNNFANTSVLMETIGWQIWNNNFPSSVAGYFDENTFGFNNFFPHAYNVPGYNTMRVDPQYISETDLHAQNPLLMGRAKRLTQISFDIDSLARPNPPSYGANEICLSGYTSVDLPCGDSIRLSFCNAPDTGIFNWTPSIGLNNPTVKNPIASATTSTLYVLTETVSGFTDSVLLNIQPFDISGNEYIELSCDDSIAIHVPYNAGAIYQWSPTEGLNDTIHSYSIAQPATSVVYTVSAYIPGCDTASHSFTIFADSLPIPLFYYDSNGLTVDFVNSSRCSESYLWDFGDSTATSTEETPSHIYAHPGTYIGRLTSYNAFGSASYSNYVYVLNPGIGEPTNDSISIYPNPAITELTITGFAPAYLKLCNTLGQTIAEANKSNKLYLGDLPQGLYVLQVFDENMFVVKTEKIIVGN